MELSQEWCVVPNGHVAIVLLFSFGFMLEEEKLYYCNFHLILSGTFIMVDAVCVCSMTDFCCSVGFLWFSVDTALNSLYIVC